MSVGNTNDAAMVTLLAEHEGPAWLFDYTHQRMLWANEAGLGFWKAQSLEEFRARDFSSDSRSVRERLWQSIQALGPNEWARDSWTLFPQNEPTTVLLESRVVEHDDTDVAILFRLVRNLDFGHADPEGLRMMLSARVTPTVVAMFDLQGDLISENPAALAVRRQYEGWTVDALHLRTRYGEPKRADDVLDAVAKDTRLRFDYRIPGAVPERVFSVTVRRILDPVSGESVALITEEDITRQAELAASLKALNEDLEERVEARAKELRRLNARLAEEIARRTEAKREAERERDFLSSLLEAVPVPIFYTDEKGAYLGCNEHWCKHVGAPKAKLVGKTAADLHDDGDKTLQADRAVVRSGVPTRQPNRFLRADGSRVDVVEFRAPYEDLDGVAGLIGTVVDVTEQKQVERELRERELMLREATLATGTGFIVYDARTRAVEYTSATVQTLLGASDEGFARFLTSVDHRFDTMADEEREPIQAVVEGAEREGKPYDIAYTLRSGQRAGRVIRARGYPLPTADGGRRKRVGFLQDISDSLQMEESLRKSQKLEAVGHLTGGVAHDFNNLLGVVLGNAQLLSLSEAYDAELVQEIEDACRRGAELTRNLLAYARKQRLNAQPIELDAHCRAIERILKRTLGADIALRLHVETGVWKAFADAGQFEDAMLNLAINARDAMPEGGTLTIEVKNATLECVETYGAAEHIACGDFVLVTVSDDGVGMTSEVLSKATDPFFTTKASGRGSGLGLSRIYGYACQSGGDLTIQSEVGDGTTVALFLPRDVSGDRAASEAPGTASAPHGDAERVLLVEDDGHVRGLMVRLLETLGYRVEPFPRAQLALDHLRAGGSADVLLSDVMLPGGMKGPDLAAIVAREFPSIRVLLMSGYLESSGKSFEALDPEITVLDKPIGRVELARALRDLLEVR